MWSFDEIAKTEPRRAELLQSAPNWEKLRAEIVQRFKKSLLSGQLAVGLEQFGRNRKHSRVVLQFHVGEILLDRFFNATTGYRAQFRLGWEYGHACNTELIMELASVLSVLASELVVCRVLSPDFKDIGTTEVTRTQILESLDPELTKMWACALVIDHAGGTRQQALGVSGPNLLLADDKKWPAIVQDEAEAFLEIKGAYLGESGPYQYKSPSNRAKALEATGEPGSA